MGRKSYSLIKLLFTILLIPMFCYGAIAQQHKELSEYENQKEATANTSITLKPGFTVPSGSSFRAYISSNPGRNLGTKLKLEMNGIVTYNVRVPGIIDVADTTNGVNQVNVEIQTLDHFGRLKETQKNRATPSFDHVVKLFEYDATGKEGRNYLPSVVDGDNLNFLNQGYSSPYTSYYNEGNSTRTPSIAATTVPYGQTKYDNSPLDLVEEVSSPGEDFQLNTGHTFRTKMMPGSWDISKYTVRNDSLVRLSPTGVYNGGNIQGTRTEDEDVIAHNGAVFEYKDFDGQVILKRIVTNVGYDGHKYLSTYYVYDERGNLCFVLPPKANADTVGIPSATVLENFCYQYKYDNQNRIIAKKLPGKGWEYMVYNALDQVVMSQDAVQRSKTNQQWNIIKYDALGRTIMTGIYTDPVPGANVNRLSTMQTGVNQQAKQWEVRTTTGNGYTNSTFPTSWATTLSLNYYDDYSFPGGNPYPYTGTEVSKMTRGMLTGGKVNVIGTSNMLWSVNYYDDYGRVAKAFKQHYKGNTLVAGNYDEVSNSYDFTGSVLTSLRSHKVAGAEKLKILNEYSYDHMGRKVNTWETINVQSKILLSQNVYDDLGNLYKKKLHSTNNGTSFLQTITYYYNTRGWLLRTQAEKLDVKMYYNTPINGATPKYNGNISEFEYTGDKSGKRWFKYSYDPYNRLQSSVYSNSGLLNEEISYDDGGNITSLKRGVPTNTPITYDYLTGGTGNQLRKVSGAVTGSFTYDLNGSALTDGTRSATLTYNLLNLPASVARSTGNASYVYDASGSKLRSIQGTVTREYISGMQYTNNVLDFVATEEGRAVRNPADSIYKYEYNLKDHLGNVRVTIDDNNGTARVVQEDEFYAFGLNAPKYALGDKNNYLYNGKELQTVLTNEYDYGARFYDPVIGRWNVIDPKAELLEMSSPYVYSLNSPVNFIDKDGELPIYINGKTSNDNERGDAIYWNTQLLRTIASSGMPNPGGTSLYVDGNRYLYRLANDVRVKNSGFMEGQVAEGRREAGYRIGKEDFQNILSQLAKDPKTGKITEKIQIYTHSRGAAFGAGYTEALLEMIENNSGKFADANNVIDYVLNLAPHQSGAIDAPGGANSFSIDHGWDMLSGDDMGNNIGFKTNTAGGSPGLSHQNKTFSREVGAFIQSFQKSKGNNNQLIDNFVNRMRSYGIKVTVK